MQLEANATKTVPFSNPRNADIKILNGDLELLWDMERIESLGGEARLILHQPQLKEVVITFDKPWEGNVSTYCRLLNDGNKYMLYYRGGSTSYCEKSTSHPECTCYAESRDGLTWTKPALGLFEFNGSTENNIIWMGDIRSHNFTPFYDTNPNCLPEEKFKAYGGKFEYGLLYLTSPDGIHWTARGDEPVSREGSFDSQNVAFWDEYRHIYVMYSRFFREIQGKYHLRSIQRSFSSDAVHWSRPEPLRYNDDFFDTELYTNAIVPYHRCPEIHIGFPKRFQRNIISKYDAYYSESFPGLSDGIFMSTRNTLNFNRFQEAFIRPGFQPDRWYNRNNMVAAGYFITPSPIEETPDEISFLSLEANASVHPTRLRRHSIRMDGFASVNAPFSGGTLLTKPFVFNFPELSPQNVAAEILAETQKKETTASQEGSWTVSLVLNASTSAAGYIRCEIQDHNGLPVPGFELQNSPRQFGDELELKLTWQQGCNLKKLQGIPLRLFFELKDADIYAYRFILEGENKQ